LQPFAKSSSGVKTDALGTSPTTIGNISSQQSYSHSSDFVDVSAGAQETSSSIQDLYDSIEEELRKAWKSSSSRRKSTDDENKDDGENKDVPAGSDANNDTTNALDKRVRAALDQIEDCITSVFYDQYVTVTSSPLMIWERLDDF
jgi:hypothetical protein